MSFADELETLIRARYPILYVVSPEEGRVVELVTQVAGRRQKNVYEWSATTGIVPAGTSIQIAKHRSSPTRDPLLALDHVIEQVEPAIFLFKDFHPYLGKSHPLVVRRLKEIALHLKNSFKSIVLVSPFLEVPVELEKEVTVLALPLPGLDELGLLLDRIREEVRRFKQIQLELDPASRDRLLQAARGLTLTEAENVFARLLVRRERLSGDDVRDVLEEKRQIVRKSGLLEYYESAEHLDHVGGLGQLKEWLRKRGLAFTESARAFGLPPPKGVLLLGVQGCGKSLCAKAVSNLWQLPLLRFDVGRVFGSYIGSSEENIRRAIGVAESVAPAILWVDEIDKAFAGTRGGSAGDSGTSARVFGTFLTWLSEKTAPVFVVATANDIAHLPPELLRKGRLDEIFFIDLPEKADREEIFRIHLAQRQRPPDNFRLAELADASADFSGAEIEQAISSALYDAFAAGEELASDHLLAALRETVPLAKTMHEQIRELRDWAAARTRPAGGSARPAEHPVPAERYAL